MILVVAATRAELGGQDGLVCGIGPVEAAAVTAAALAREAPAALLHVGLAGARRVSRLVAPVLVIGTEALYCDIAAAVPVVARAEPDVRLLQVARRTLPHARALPIGTSARVDGSSGTDVEAMEGFAVLRAAELAGVPALEVRAIANEIEERDRARWRLGEALAALEASLPPLIAALGS